MEQEKHTSDPKGRKGLTWLALISIGGTIFSMHFGGASMIWPVTWGKMAGRDVLEVYLGVFPTALFLPWVAYYAVARGGSLSTMAKRVGRAFEYLFALPAMLIIGPLFTIPRMSAASWDALSALFGFSRDNVVSRIVFQLAYYMVAYWFLAKLSDIVDKMSRFLVPFLLVLVFAIIVKGVLDPIGGWAEPSYGNNALSWGFVSGYQTSELLVALAFAGLIMFDLKGRGIQDEGDQLRYLMLTAAIGIGILCLTHLGHMLVGARTGHEFEELRYADLYASVVMRLWGRVGGALFNLGLLLAALTTAIGCNAGVSSYIEELTKGRLSYNAAAVGISAVSMLVSSMGLSRIIQFTAPLFSITYPPSIVLTIGYSLLQPWRSNRHAACIRVAAWTSLILGWVDALLIWFGPVEGNRFLTALITFLNRYIAAVPGGEQGLGWVIPSLVAGLATWIAAGNSSGTAVEKDA
ncbi:MAG TPA: hypothetical protein GXX30_04100 [Firmicutes bacterium]|nr:hypothetical protein [Candidatus Fermentithermobacillaceae bacterium]